MKRSTCLKKHKRTWPPTLLLLVLSTVWLLTLSACLKMEAKRPEITLIIKSTTSNFYENMINGVKAAANEYNLDYRVEGPANEEDYRMQNELILAAVKRKTSAILLSAVSYEYSVDAVEQAVAARIPVLILDSDVDSDGPALRIGTDNEAAGRQAAAYLYERARGGAPLVVGVINFSIQTENGQARERGVRGFFQDKKDVTIYPTVTVDSLPASAEAGAKRLLSEHPDINALVTFNEWTTLGVGQAVADLDRTDTLSLIGFDSNPSSVDLLERGLMTALIVQNPFSMGYLGVERARAVLAGARYPKRDMIYTETTVVTRELLADLAVQKLVFPIDEP